MKLNIKNFAKIKEADIVIDGITVIAGENNTGKSTVGKVLFSLFNALSDIDQKISEERLKEIEYTNRPIIANYVGAFDLSRNVVNHLAISNAMRIKEKLCEYQDDGLNVPDETIHRIVSEVIQGMKRILHGEEKYDWLELTAEVYQNTKEIMYLPEEVITKEFVSRYFNNVFHGQIQSLANKEHLETALALDIKGKKTKLYFEKNNCKELKCEMNITHKAIYIDNPFIVDELSKNNRLDPMSEMLEKLLLDSYKEDAMEGIIESVRATKKLSEILGMLQSVVGGEVSLDQNNEFYLKNDECDEPISFHNLSTGMKSFVILKMLLEKGCLKNKDVVILDEPEIHLHPQWQIAYAELIVLLQKQFDLSVVVTTHSPYFVDALNLFSCKYGTDNKVNYYLSSNEGDAVTMQLVTDEIDLIYKKMASPIQMLDTLRYELNNK